MSYFSNLADALQIVSAVGAVKEQVAGMTDVTVGDEAEVRLPFANLNALVVKGKDGSRFRFVGAVFRREK